MADPLEDYGIDLPSEVTLASRFSYAISFWQNRNKFIADVRKAAEGLNEIEAPVSTQYKIRVLHTYILASLLNEKMARYMSLPSFQVIPDDDLDDAAREKSSRIERALNVGNYEIERKSDGDVWNRVVMDSILLDEGVEKILCSPNAFWYELVQNDREVKAGIKAKSSYPMKSKERDQYKKENGVPLTKWYVPLEYYFPIYDGPNLVEQFEISERSVISVLNNSLFANEDNERGQEALRTLTPSSKDGGVSRTVTIVEYVNNVHHAYYLASYQSSNSNGRWPRVTPVTTSYGGQLRYLYSYEHGIGRSIYNSVAGRLGGWKTQTNRIEGVGKALVELGQAADEIVSQVFTNVRAKYWPSLNFQMDPEKRGFGVGQNKPDAPTIKEGEAIVTFTGEDIKPIFKPEEDPMAMWLFSTIQEQIGKLGGSTVLFGGREPGVDTGYHQALQTTAAESLDEKTEQHVAIGASQEALIEMLYYKHLGEKIWMHYQEVDPGDSTRKRGKYVYLDPEDLTPMPRLDVQVRKQRPVDYIAALRAAREASDDRQGKGPLLSDDTIRAEILSIQAPDMEYKKTIIESQKREIINNGVLSSQIGDAINIKLAKLGTPNISPEVLSQADPSLVAAIQQGSEGTAQAGGLDPKLLGQMAQAPGAGLPPGPLPGDPEEQNRLGEAVAGAIQTGSASI